MQRADEIITTHRRQGHPAEDISSSAKPSRKLVRQVNRINRNWKRFFFSANGFMSPESIAALSACKSSTACDLRFVELALPFTRFFFQQV